MRKIAEIMELPDGSFATNCPSCGELKVTDKRKNAVRARFRECHACSNRKIENSGHKGWFKEVLRASFVNGYIKSAKQRHLAWEVTGDYLAELLIAQDFKCALSGIEIEAKNARKNTASLDRIDSTKGYTVGNLQWVYAPINMMKQSFSQEEFTFLCKKVAEWDGK